MITKTTRMTLMHEDDPTVFSPRATHVSIDDEAAGEFVVVEQCDADLPQLGQIRVNPEEWKTLRDVIDNMVANCK